jgi:hypothetical protein
MKAGPTPYPDINALLADLVASVQRLLRAHMIGMYLYGSLALGDFDRERSDIDLIVVTDGELDRAVVDALTKMHDAFITRSSPWPAKLEVAYVPRQALHPEVDPKARYPQLEKDRELALEPLESGWVIQLYTLREHGIVVAGPAAHTLVPLIDPAQMRRASAAYALVWADQSTFDPEWLEWVRDRRNQAFVVLTLCRMLYTLDSGRVASKPQAARWMTETTGTRWAALIENALVHQDAIGTVSPNEVQETIALIDHTVEHYRRIVTP